MSLDVVTRPRIRRRPASRGRARTPDPLVVSIVGRAGAGKSEFARALTKQMEAQYPAASIVSFNDVIKRRAMRQRRKGWSTRRLMVQVGADWVANDPAGLVRNVWKMRSPDARLVVVDGVHHHKVLQLLRRAVGGSPTFVIHLKAPEELVLRVARAQDTSLKPDEVLDDSTEHDVDRDLLAEADLVLDGSVGVDENAAAAANYVQSRSDHPVKSPEFIGGLDEEQRKFVVIAVTEESGWLLPSEVANELGVGEVEVHSMIADHVLFTVDVNGAQLCPGFVLKDGRLHEGVSRASVALHDELTQWELALWFIAANGHLDGARPIDGDVDETDLSGAVQEELDL